MIWAQVAIAVLQVITLFWNIYKDTQRVGDVFSHVVISIVVNVGMAFLYAAAGAYSELLP